MDLIREINQPFQLAIDIDGVLADFDRGIFDLMGKYPHEFERTKEMWEAITEAMKTGKEFFADLPMMSDAQLLIDSTEEYSPFFLTSTGHIMPEFVAMQKKKWIAKHFGMGHQVITVRNSRDKQQYIDPSKTSILIDDRTKSIDPWIAKGGVGILHTSTAQTLIELEKIIEGTTDA